MRKAAFVIVTLAIFVSICWLLYSIRNLSATATRVLSQNDKAIETINPLRTAAAYGFGTTAPEGRLSVINTREGLESLHWFVFTEETIDGQPALAAKLTAEGENHYPEIGGGFTGIFLGDPDNLTQIIITVPRTEKEPQDVVNNGPWLIQSVLTGLLPFSPDEKGIFFDWIDSNFLTVPVGGEQETTIKNIQFIFVRPETNKINLTVTPGN